MSLKLKRVLYALALGLVFAIFCTITEAGTPKANVTSDIVAVLNGLH